MAANEDSSNPGPEPIVSSANLILTAFIKAVEAIIDSEKSQDANSQPEGDGQKIHHQLLILMQEYKLLEKDIETGHTIAKSFFLALKLLLLSQAPLAERWKSANGVNIADSRALVRSSQQIILLYHAYQS